MSTSHQEARQPPRADPLDPLIARFGQPLHQKKRSGTTTAVFRLSDDGDAVLCHRRAPSRDLDLIRAVDELLTYAEAESRLPALLVVAVAGGLLPHADRPDLHLIERYVAGGLRTVLWSRPEAISRNPDCAREHLTAVSGGGAELVVPGLGKLDLVAFDIVMTEVGREAAMIRQRMSTGRKRWAELRAVAASAASQSAETAAREASHDTVRERSR